MILVPLTTNNKFSPGISFIQVKQPRVKYFVLFFFFLLSDENVQFSFAAQFSPRWTKILIIAVKKSGGSKSLFFCCIYRFKKIQYFSISAAFLPIGTTANHFISLTPVCSCHFCIGLMLKWILTHEDGVFPFVGRLFGKKKASRGKSWQGLPATAPSVLPSTPPAHMGIRLWWASLRASMLLVGVLTRYVNT